MSMERKKRKLENRENSSVRNRGITKSKWPRGCTVRQKKATESHNRQEQGAEITVVQVLMEVATKKLKSARNNLESSHKEKQNLIESARKNEQLICCSCKVYFK